MNTKKVFFLFFLFFSLQSFSQELFLGGNLGFAEPLYASRLNSFGVSFEYRPVNALMSFNTNPFLTFIDKKVFFTEPVYVKFIFGKKLRFCPSGGAFIRSNGNYGWVYGAGIEYIVKSKLNIFVKGDFYTDYYEAEYPNHFGGSYFDRTHETTLLISFGIKKIIINKSAPNKR